MAGTALFLYALLAASVIETFWHGSPVRWPVSAIVLTNVVLTALFWPPRSWLERAIGAVLALMVALAVTVWLPGGRDNGLRVIGLQTPTLLSMTVVGGAALAAYLFVRERRLPYAVRVLGMLLTAGGVLVLLWGPAPDVPFLQLFSGAGVPPTLRGLVHATLLGTLLMVLAAVIMNIARAGFRATPDGSFSHRLQQSIALAASVSILCAGVPTARDSQPIRAANGPARAAPPVDKRVANFEGSMNALQEGLGELPRHDWDLQALVDALDRDPQQMFEWVRDNTHWIPYQGVLKGAVGVLMERQGNNLDRALLLASLLERSGRSATLAHRILPEEDARDLLPWLIARRDLVATPLLLQDIPRLDIRGAAHGYSLDVEAVQQTIDTSADAMRRVRTAIDGRVEKQSSWLRKAMPWVRGADDLRERQRRALDDLRDYWWVQAEGRNFDLLGVGVDSSRATPDSVVEPSRIDAAQHHSLTVRVVSEQWASGGTRERIALEHVLRPADLIGQQIVLQFWPASELDAHNPRANLARTVSSTRTGAYAEWVAALSIGTEVAELAILDEGSEGPSGGGPMGGLGQGIAGAFRRSAGNTGKKPVTMTAVWIEYEIRAPGSEPHRVRRVVFDLLGAERRAVPPVSLQLTDVERATRSDSLMMRTEILPVITRLAPTYLAYLVAQSVLANRPILEAALRDEFTPVSAETAALIEGATPPVGPLNALAVSRDQWSPVSDATYIHRIGVLTRHVYPDRSDGALKIVQATDIVSNEIGVSLSIEDAASVRLAQGVFDTNAEALLQGGQVVGNPSAGAAAGTIIRTLSDLASTGLEIDSNVRSRIGESLADGYVVVLPIREGSHDGVSSWWRIHPVRGDTLGIGWNGWGLASTSTTIQTAGEDSLTRSAVAGRAASFRAAMRAFTKNFAIGYGFCLLATTVPAIERGGPGGRAVAGLDAVLTTPSECTGDAVFMGMLATLPLLLATLRYTIIIARAGSTTATPSSGTAGAPPSAGTPPPEGAPPRPAVPPDAPAAAPEGTPSEPSVPPADAPPAPGEPPPPPARGPYRSDPVGRQQLGANPSDAREIMGGDRMLKAIDAADAAAQNEYDMRIKQGASDQLAHDYSRDAWQRAFEGSRPAVIGRRPPTDTADLGKTQPDAGKTLPGGGPLHAPVRGGPEGAGVQKTVVGLGGMVPKP